MITYLFVSISYLLMAVGVLVCVAFIVLLERKVLGYIQIRSGPNKVGVLGILQSFSDAVKLFTKEQIIPSYSNILIFYLSPLVFFLVILMVWGVLAVNSNFVNLELGGLFFVCCASFGVYAIMGSGWASSSNYAMLGTIRAVAQTISYEVALVFFLLGLFMLSFSLNFLDMGSNQEYMWFGIFLPPLLLMWLASMLAETNRTPCDFAEGESELISGFNVEYGSGRFALLFLSEYGSIIFMSYLIVVLFLGGFKNTILLGVLGMVFCFTFIWLRGTFPRFRYDSLMLMAWKSILPASLSIFLFLYFMALAV